MIKRIFLDMDGVICDLVSEVLSRFKLSESDLKPNVYDLDSSLGEFVINDIINWDIETWKNLKPTTEKGELILKFKKEFPLAKKIICSKPSGANSISGKMQWIAKHCDLDYIFVNDKSILADENSILVDDCEEQINKFALKGGKTILIPRIWNTGYNLDLPLMFYVSQCIKQIKNEGGML